MRIDVHEQLSEVNATLSEIYQRLDGGLTPLMQAIGAIVEGSTRERFGTKTAPDGTSWAALRPSTVAIKNGRGSLMVDRGDLMRSITHHATAVSIEVGTDRPYAKYLQTGTKKSDGTQRMVARPFLGLSEDDFTDIRELLNDFLEDLS